MKKMIFFLKIFTNAFMFAIAISYLFERFIFHDETEPFALLQSALAISVILAVAFTLQTKGKKLSVNKQGGNDRSMPKAIRFLRFFIVITIWLFAILYLLYSFILHEEINSIAFLCYSLAISFLLTIILTFLPIKDK